MEERIEILLAGGVASFHPGEALSGTVSWSLGEPPTRAEVRLFWHTAGRGTEDVGVIATVPLADLAAEGSHHFQFRLPSGPWSFSGRLISLLWAVEAVVWPGPRAGRCGFVLSPTGEEVVLPSVASASP